MIFLVGEIGVNWDGDYEIVKNMMHNAKDSGFDAVKFQAFSNELVRDHPQRQRLMNSSINDKNIETIDKLSRSEEIEWFCTPMYTEAVDLLVPFVTRFKIREFDGRPLLENKTTNLLERILKTNKEIIVSSEKSPKNTKYYHNPNIKWLYTVPKYPCSIDNLDFGNLKDFDGYSNHHPHFIAPLVASILGAQIIEVHITSDKTKDFIDNNVSFDYTEIKQLVRLIRLSEQIIK